MKIPVNSTPSFSTDWSGQGKQYPELMGRDRVKTELGRYPDFARAGNRVSISADVPSTMPAMQAPLFCVEAAVTMMQPDNQGTSKPFPPGMQGLTVEQAIRAVTIDAAWQLRMDDKIGSLVGSAKKAEVEAGRICILEFRRSSLPVAGVSRRVTRLCGRLMSANSSRS